MSTTAQYQDPLGTRYASPAMRQLWSAQQRAQLWRQLWIDLAQAEKDLGLAITDEQIHALEAAKEHIDFDRIREYEKRFRHDVMAHIHAYEDAAPAAAGKVHQGATSCFVTDNADLLLMRRGLSLLIGQVVGIIRSLAAFARTYRSLPTLGFTHFQPAQPTTVGKRACLWLHDLLLDLEELEHRYNRLRLRGAKGTTGTQASFLALFDGDHEKVRQLDQLIAQRHGIAGTYPVTGQTYTRKIDSQVLDTLSGVAQSAHKFACDLRLLAHRQEVEEPFEAEQIGSSAMAYKRNPMRAERMCSLARFVMNLPANAAQTHATQWLERTLDDSANRRLVIPQAFLATDAVLRLYNNVAAGLVVHEKVVERRLQAELPFMATENILMAAVKQGKDRQELHEVIRRHSLAAADRIKREGIENDLLTRLQSDEHFAGLEWTDVLNPAHFIGRAPQQVDEFLAEHVEPVLANYADVAAADGNIEV